MHKPMKTRVSTSKITHAQRIMPLFRVNDKGASRMRVKHKVQQLAVIIPAMNEERTLAQVLRVARELNPAYLIVVVNGSSDRTAAIARHYRARLLEYSYALGYDIGRALGALAVEADIYLFLDADFVLQPEQMQPLVAAIAAGADVALNSLRYLEQVKRPDVPTVDRFFINLLARRPDLGLESLVTVPHAISHKGLLEMGKMTLANPFLATLIAQERKLVVKNATAINVLAKNRRRPNHAKLAGESMSRASQRIHGDSVEAVYYLIQKYGRRGLIGSGNYRRQYFQTVFANADSLLPIRQRNRVSAVLSVTKYARELTAVLQDLKNAGLEIVAVMHDGTEELRQLLEKNADRLFEFPEFIGHDVAFAIGASAAKGAVCIFHDLAFLINGKQLINLVKPISLGEADIVLSDQGHVVGNLATMRPVHVGNMYANITMGMRELGASSMMIPPFALGLRAREVLADKLLLNPCLAQMYVRNCGLKLVTAVVGFKKLELTRLAELQIFNIDRVLGDFMEAIWYWTERYGYRGGFTDEGRRRNVFDVPSDVYHTTSPEPRFELPIDLDWLFA